VKPARSLGFVARRFAALFRKRRLDKELEGEIFAHMEMAEFDAIAAGLSPEEARRRPTSVLEESNR
jgi:hypothetical protein